jgi:hypothetical protein
VFAYSNRAGGECAIIIYNNAYNTTRGTIHTSTAINVADGAQTVLVRRTLADTLGLDTGDNSFYAFRDHQSGLEYIRSGRQLAEQGLFVELHAYQYHAFLDFRLIRDSDGSWRELERRLGGAGVPSLEEVYRELQVEPILGPYRELMNPATIRELMTNRSKAHDNVCTGVRTFYQSVGRAMDATVMVEPLIRRFMTQLMVLESSRCAGGTKGKSRKLKVEEEAWEKLAASELDHVAFAWLTFEALAEFHPDRNSVPSPVLAVSQVDQWLLLKAVKGAFEGWLSDSDTAYWDSRLVLVLLAHSDLLTPGGSRSLGESFRHALLDTTVREYLQVHMYDDVLWLNKERLERMTAALCVIGRVSAEVNQVSSKEPEAETRRSARRLLAAGERAGYRVEKMILALNQPEPERKSGR